MVNKKRSTLSKKNMCMMEDLYHYVYIVMLLSNYTIHFLNTGLKPPNCVTSLWTGEPLKVHLDLNLFLFMQHTHTHFNQTACHSNQTINLQHPCLPFGFGMGRFDYIPLHHVPTSQRPRFQAYHRKPPCGRERPREEMWGKCVLEPGTCVTLLWVKQPLQKKALSNRSYMGSRYMFIFLIIHLLHVNW